MDIFDAARVVRRWWFVAVPLFLLTILVTLVATAGIAPVHTAEASVIFVGPSVAENDQNELEAVNPLLNQSSALVTAAVVSSLSLQAPEVVEILDEEDLSTDFDVGTEARTPILLLEVRADSSEVATATALRLVELVESDVQLRQEASEVPANLRATTSLIGFAPAGEPDNGSQTQARIALLAIGLTFNGGIIFALEGLSRRGGSTATRGVISALERFVRRRASATGEDNSEAEPSDVEEDPTDEQDDLDGTSTRRDSSRRRGARRTSGDGDTATDPARSRAR